MKDEYEPLERVLILSPSTGTDEGRWNIDPREPLREIARGRLDCGRPLAAEKARQLARKWLLGAGETCWRSTKDDGHG